MGMITLVFTLMIAAAGYALWREAFRARGVAWVRSLGLLALVLGVLGQLIGLYDAFSAIQQMGQVSQAMLAGGLKVSSITTLYGLGVYALALVVSLLLGLGIKEQGAG